MMNHALERLLSDENERNFNFITNHSTDKENNDKDNKEGKIKRVNSTPIWPTELPDVFSFPDSFFELQKDLDYCVYEYLIRMGYADAANSFKKEIEIKMTNDEGGNSEDKIFIEGIDDENKNNFNFDNKMNQLFKISNEVKNEQNEKVIKEHQSNMGIKSVNERKEIMILILNGKIKESIEFIEAKWPFFFNEFSMIKLRLLHAEAIEMIRDFFDNDVSKLNNEEIENMEKSFFKKFVNFIKINLSDNQILKSKRFIKDMELTMGLLSFVKFKNERNEMILPRQLQDLFDFSLRETISIRVNKALLTYVDGVKFNNEFDFSSDKNESLNDCIGDHTDDKYGNANDDITDEGKDIGNEYGNTDVREDYDDTNHQSLSKYGIGDDDPNDPLLVDNDNIQCNGNSGILQKFNNGDTKLAKLVKLFIWSYQLNDGSGILNSVSRRNRADKMVEITLS